MSEINKIYNQDCLTGMNLIDDKSIDMVLCDLPYGITKCKWDKPIDFNKLWGQYNRIIKDNGAILLFGTEPFASKLRLSNEKFYRYDWVWEKTQATGHLNAKRRPLQATEYILVFYKHLPIYNPQKTHGHKPVNTYTKYVETQNKTELYGNVIKEIKGGGDTDRYPRNILTFASDKQKCKLHPTQKPVALCEYLIKTYTNGNELILDNCMRKWNNCSCLYKHK